MFLSQKSTLKDIAIHRNQRCYAINTVVRKCRGMDQSQTKGDKPDFRGSLDVTA
jgi:hypothetical protein